MVFLKNKKVFQPSLGVGVYFTNHAQGKMRFYHLSEARVRRVLHSPKRIEEGIAPGTIAMMQGAGSIKHPYEIWVMIVKNKSSKLKAQSQIITKVISAWKYPGITKPGQPLPEEILREMREAI